MSEYNDYKRMTRGMFNTVLDSFERKKVKKFVSAYHIRNSVKHEDGSIGEIKITPMELNDLLAYFLMVARIK